MKRKNCYLSTVSGEAPELAREYGLGLELAEFCTAWNLDDEFPETDRKVRKEMKSVDRFTLHGPYNELFPCAVDRRARTLASDRYLQTIRTAEHYGIHKIIFHGGYAPMAYYPCWYQEQSVLFWKQFAENIPEDMELCLENVLEPEPDLLADIVRQVNDPRIRMCVDVGHVNAYSSVSPEQWVRQCADVIDHFHIHNNDGSADTHSSLNRGTIPMEKLLAEISELCPEATLTMELPKPRESLRWLDEKKLWED